MHAAASIGNAARQMMDGSVVPYAGEEALYPVFINEVRLAETASGWFGRAHGLARLVHTGACRHSIRMHRRARAVSCSLWVAWVRASESNHSTVT